MKFLIVRLLLFVITFFLIMSVFHFGGAVTYTFEFGFGLTTSIVLGIVVATIPKDVIENILNE